LSCSAEQTSSTIRDDSVDADRADSNAHGSHWWKGMTAIESPFVPHP